MPQPGFFELYPMVQPALPAGAYLLAADHELTATPPNGADGDISIDGSDFTFKIVAPRYTMPPEQILSTFPPANAVGDWRERLPQIVFKRRTLPWERNPDAVVAFDDSTPPWLALVVLAEGEGTLSAAVPVEQCVTPGLHLDGDVDTAQGRYLEVDETLVKRIFPTIEDLRLLCHVRHVDLADTELALGDDDGYLSVVLANRLAQPGPPTAESPTPVAKKYTAYLINLEGQLPELPTIEESETVLEFATEMRDLLSVGLFATADGLGIGADEVVSIDALVMRPAERFLSRAPNASAESNTDDQAVSGTARAAASGLSTNAAGAQVGVVQGAAAGIEHAAAAYAVGPATASLVRADDTREARQWLTGTSMTELGGLAGHLGVFPLVRRLRFPVLTSWDFVCTGDGGFEALMKNLESGMLGTEGTAVDPALRPEIAVTGHVGLSHRTRRGEQARSWYRGPLVPQPTIRVAPNPADGSLPIAHAGDQLRRVVPDGREDVSLACAFEIGRLLALSKPGLVAALMEWRSELFGAARASKLSAELLDTLIAGIGQALLVGKGTLDDLVTNELFIPYIERVPDAIGPRARQFSTARVPDDFEAFRPRDILAGLGLDSVSVRKATSSFGVEGLATLDPTVGEVSTNPLSSSKTDLAAMQQLLGDHAETLAIETLKIIRRDGGVIATDPPPSATPASDTAANDTAANATIEKKPRRPARDELDAFLAQAERNLGG